MTNFPITPPTIDQATIDHYVAKGSRERSQAVRTMFRGLLKSTKHVGSTETPKIHGCATA